ncbi:hypothetical protein PPYR_14743 [Photinus pyralis]|uniref:Replication protein A OB domain-containing protein n=1 Tax=Photinus pyralis TaxID=7054 RepID=A0A5N4A623_PHOPY|nr:uncharacterized protein LOC116172103 [Photinus pyralis]XP_031356425.1 uncharacterized protein LOC116180528 [Photinus pyralis]XP_031356426.1 uncharacterized protein LOC116180528 [Photinus pyralis]XP_031356427.1 uncharacterized protein LOC116180528 [Photinus pyralis]XP_031356428.1 uncharacterized protein LOC116180528 [Photinus pyralis]KAB0792784.1 hypothetical protein PPYR_14743 [Photinus pyralis]
MAESTAIPMTTNEEIDAVDVGDNTMEIIAYVDSIEGIKYVSKNKALLKFIINNGTGRRIRVLAWEENAKSYENKLSIHQIIHIQRGLFLRVNPNYFRKEENLIPFEISLTKNSKVDFLGKYATEAREMCKVVSTTIKDCASIEGKLSLDAYIKVTFEPETTSHSSYGSGAIMEGIYKLRVRISHFHQNPALVEGAHIRLIGEIKKDRYDSIYLQVADNNDITVIDDKVLSKETLRGGIHTPRKRPLQDANDNGEEIVEKSPRMNLNDGAFNTSLSQGSFDFENEFQN